MRQRPATCRKRTRTTNAIERLNGELRRRERVIRIFSNRASVLRLFEALAEKVPPSRISAKRK